MKQVDVVVVGSGAGGAPVALRLAEAGATVAVLERGPRYERSHFVHDELRVARRNFFIPSVHTDPHVVAQEGGPAEKTNEGWIACCVGGGTVHMSGFFYPFQPADFRLRALFGDVPEVIDWPIAHEELAAYYGVVAREVGVSGPERAGRAAIGGGYPMPAVAAHPAATLIDAAAQRLGVQAIATPRAILTEARPGRGACVYCHFCGSFGCESGAKGSTLEALIPRAEATGKCTVLPEWRAVEITAHPDGRARGVRMLGPAGQEDELQARAVVVAASAVESARLLLMSTSGAWPNGLGNAEGQVGRNLVFSTLSKAHGRFQLGHPERDPLVDSPAPFLGRSVLDYYVPAANGPRKAGALNFLLPPGGPIFRAESLALRSGFTFGRELLEGLRAAYHGSRQLDCETFGEYLPTSGTRVTLDDHVQDAAGLPVARIEVRRHPHDHEVSRYLAQRASALLEAAGADEVWTTNLDGQTMHLPMGTVRMGADPATSVVDANGRVHGVPNVFASDGGVLPSSGGVPPTFTILANAFRIGDGLVAAFARREL